ncbi:MAG: stage II sporulation protein M [Prevotella sp.]|uniref:stage II sporulation protein M n=1 Tax=Prevotella sp. TaxID=59823 RepID=UPI002A282B48|nr:stage II sporulation protein M [Prevotella sp.]MDD7317562.1 stage II sporulation protein M [Prevotellaceae bacterium]MDY4020591.1 stage II sporulation protein M [Prevotella sp.]
MKEASFIRNNIEKWRRTEELVGTPEDALPDEMAEAYTEITADLAFAQTHYRRSRITLYLNDLASALHNAIYSNKKEKWTRIFTYWTHEVPLTMYDARRELLASFLIFAAFVLVGVVSQLYDTDFSRLILGDYYVDMTLENISKGEPMAVYNGGSEVPMFLQITINNVMVSFFAFVLGIFACVGTGVLLMQNGIMLGAFQTFFFSQGLLLESALAIWLHGTLEISAIIISGAAGMALGSGWLFPGTYKRGVAFRRGARRGLKIVVGTVPVFILAGFIEGFVTRHTEIHDAVRAGIILFSLAFVIFYFVIWPRALAKRVAGQSGKLSGF